MRVALVHDWLTGMRGGEKCLEALCAVLPQARVFTLLHRPGSTSPVIENRRICTSPLQYVPGAVQGGYRYLLPLLPWAVEELHVPEDVDVVLSLSHAVAKGVVVPQGVPHVCYCFTPMRWAWHLQQQYLSSPEGEPASVLHRLVQGGMREAKRWVLEQIRTWDQATVGRVSHFVACSQTVAARVIQFYGRSCQVIYPPVDTQFFTPSDVPREDYYLWVSALVPYKRVDLVVEAMRRLGRRLVIIGDGPLRNWVQKQCNDRIHFLGWQPNAVIRQHYRRCQAVVFPALEDFGIVPVEAQACGTPVIALGQGGACETVLEVSPQQQGTGWFFHQQSVDSLVEAILRFEKQRKCFSPQLARANALRFSTGKFQQQMLQLLREVVQQGQKADCSLDQVAQAPTRAA